MRGEEVDWGREKRQGMGMKKKRGER